MVTPGEVMRRLGAGGCTEIIRMDVPKLKELRVELRKMDIPKLEEITVKNFWH